MGEYHYFVAWFVFGVERESFDVPEDYFSIWWPWSKLKTIFGVPSHSVHWVVMPHETVKLHQSFYTFLLRFLISQRLTSLSSPPDSSKWGLFRLKSTEYTSPVCALRVRAGFPSLFLVSHLCHLYPYKHILSSFWAVAKRDWSKCDHFTSSTP